MGCDAQFHSKHAGFISKLNHGRSENKKLTNLGLGDKSASTSLYYIYLISGLGNIDDQSKYQ